MTKKRSPEKPLDGRLEKIFYSKEEVAFALAISTRSIDRLIEQRRLDTRRFGRRILIPAASVKEVTADIMADKLWKLD